MDILLATSNENKVKELNILLEGKAQLSSPSTKIEVIEDGLTYEANAFLKAKSYYNHFKKPVIADDSGLSLEAFPEILGVQSARFSPELTNYSEKCLKLLEIYKKNQESNRNAKFICILCLVLSESEFFFFEGESKGTISTTLRGEKGFGYDPIFLPNQHPDALSFAEDSDWKHKNGHRIKAVEGLKQFIENRSKSMDFFNGN